MSQWICTSTCTAELKLSPISAYTCTILKWQPRTFLVSYVLTDLLIGFMYDRARQASSRLLRRMQHLQHHINTMRDIIFCLLSASLHDDRTMTVTEDVLT